MSVPSNMTCVWDECKDWTWDGAPCWAGRKGSVNPIYFADQLTSWNMHAGCEYKQMRGYEHTDFKGRHIVMRGHGNVPEGWDNIISSVKEVDVPLEKDGHIAFNVDGGECHGAAEKMEKSSGDKWRCYYDDDDASKIRMAHVHKNDSAYDGNAYARAREKFCALEKNVFKNHGDGLCSELDDDNKLKKGYCSKNDRIKSDASCTEANLGTTLRKELIDTYCASEAGKIDGWCGCIHAKKGRCDLVNASDYAGCDEVNQAHDDLIEDIPDSALSGGVRQQLKERKHCRAKICDDPDRHVPEGAVDNCTLNLQVCVQDVKVAGHLVDSGIEVKCEQKQEVTTSGQDGETTVVSGDGTKALKQGPVGGGEDGFIVEDKKDVYAPKVVGKPGKSKDDKTMTIVGIVAAVLCVLCMFVVLIATA